MVKHFGSDVNVNSLSIQWNKKVRPSIQKLRDHVKAGGDAKDFDLGTGSESKVNKTGQNFV